MDEIANQQKIFNELYDFDLIQLPTGEVLSVVGNYKSKAIRARLTYFPDSENGTLLIDGRKYSKVRVDQGYEINNVVKVLDLPGEQHFIIDKQSISKVFSPRNANLFLSDDLESTIYREFCELISKNCGVNLDDIGIGGSRAVNAWRLESDFDVIIYNEEIERVKQFIVNNPEFLPELTFSLEFARRKYGHFFNFSIEDLNKLFLRRWKYMNFKGLQISLSFVDKEYFADEFLDIKYKNRKIKIAGKVANRGSSFSPRIIVLQSPEESNLSYKVFTWLFLYNGAFQIGDQVEVFGDQIELNGEEYILIENSDSYIKLIES